jgi:hypothetical protein
MVEVARISETLVNFYQTTRRYNPEDSHLHRITFPGFELCHPEFGVEMNHEVFLVSYF